MSLRRSLRAGLLLPCLLVLGLTACAVGEPLETSDVTDTGATLHGNVYSNLDGDTEYWWRYGVTEAYDSETPHGTIAISDEEPHPVSEPVTGLTADTTYHFQFCVKDAQESPPQDLQQPPDLHYRPGAGRLADRVRLEPRQHELRHLGHGLEWEPRREPHQQRVGGRGNARVVARPQQDRVLP